MGERGLKWILSAALLAAPTLAWADPPLKVNLKAGPEGAATEGAEPAAAKTAEKATEGTASSGDTASEGTSSEGRGVLAGAVGGLPWGATPAAVFKAIPKLRRSAGSLSKVKRALKRQQDVILPSMTIPWQGRSWPGHLYMDDKGLFKVALQGSIEVGGEPDFIGRWMAGLPAPKVDADGRKIWQGPATTIVLKVVPVGMDEEVELILMESSRFKSGGLSVGID